MLTLSHRMSQLGTETAFEVLARASELQRAGHDIINLGIGQPDFSTPAHIVEAGRKALRDGHHGYTPANGIPPLRERGRRPTSIAATASSVDPAQVLVVPGGKVTMFFAIMMFGEARRRDHLSEPRLSDLRERHPLLGRDAGADAAARERPASRFSAEEVLARITPRTRLLIINSPANPTGGVVPKAEMDKLVAGLARHPQVAMHERRDLWRDGL